MMIKSLSTLLLWILPVSLGFNLHVPTIKSSLKRVVQASEQDRVFLSTLDMSISSNIRDDLKNAPVDRTEEAIFLLGKVDTILNAEMKSIQQFQEETLAKIDALHAQDLELCASLGRENSCSREMTLEIPEYEWVYANDGKTGTGGEEEPSKRPLAIRTTNQPLLDETSISIIREAAQTWWSEDQAEDDTAQSASDLTSKSTKSRFTYQRTGNYEAHLVDLADHVDGRIRTIAMDALRQKIYPLVRDAFRFQISDLDDFDLCVYDSLVIRYNSTEAMMADQEDTDSPLNRFLGAGQPLHRDQALISVNIMLNPSSEFEGGGTFFENQLRSEMVRNDISAADTPKPLKPLGAGHAVAHLSSERHAGVGTTEGVRDILVLFLTARKQESSLASTSISKNDALTSAAIPRMERASRLKNNARQHCSKCATPEDSIICKILHHRLSILYAPMDGEAWHYLGMSLYSKAKSTTSARAAMDIMQLSISCIEYALKLIPCDGRLCNNLGLASEALSSYTQEHGYDLLVEKYYERSVFIHQLSEKVGCDVRSDFDSVSLNYGLYISYRDEFYRAAKILGRFRSGRKYVKDEMEQIIISDGIRLLQFFESQM